MSETEVQPPVHALHHHPAVKWILMVAMLCVGGLSLPRTASAAAPSVQAPSGAMSGGSFTGPFTFNYYMNCTNGVSFNSSYTSNLDGNNSFSFYGATDGSLLLSINGGGEQLLNSCGDPYTGRSLVVSYNVAKNTAPQPTPTPTPQPTTAPTSAPTPTAVPVSGSAGGSNGSSGSTTGGPVAQQAQTSSHQSVAAAGGTTATTPITMTEPQSVPASASTDTTSGTGGSTSGGPSNASTTKPVASSAITKMTAPQNIPKVLGILLAATLSLGAVLALFLYSLRHRAVWHWLSGVETSLALRFEPLLFRIRMKLKYRHGIATPRQRGVAHHRFSGRLLAHHHTSYSGLAFMLVATTFAVAGVSLTSHAADSSLSLNVNGPAPITGATITDPVDGTSVIASTLTVRGTCSAGLRVELTRNSNFAGSTLCDSQGLYSLVMSLVSGSNLLLASNFDGADQPGPATAPVTVTYTPPLVQVVVTPTPSVSPSTSQSTGGGVAPKTPAATKSPTTSKKLMAAKPVTLDVARHYYAGLTVGQNFSWPVTVNGGVTPYSFNVDWGDQSVSKQLTNETMLTPTHSYSASGFYHIVFSVNDGSGQTGLLSVVAVVTGAAAAAITSTSPPNDGLLMIAWPILIGASLIVFSFWLGERDRLGRLRPVPVPI